MKKQCKIRKALSLCLIAGMLVTSISTMGVSAKNKPALSCKKMVLRVGEKKKLSMKKTNKKVIWSSRNKKIATVNKKGIVCGKHVGTTKIVARIQKKKYICAVKVTKKEKQPMTTAATGTDVLPANTQPAPVMTSPAAETVQPDVTVQPTSTPTVTPTVVPAPTLMPTPENEHGPAWEAGKLSGTKEDFETYFNPDMKQYTKRQKNAPQGRIKDITYYSEVVGADREASVYLPPNYDEDKEYPVLYMLHGIGCDRGQWRYMSLNEILSNMINRGEVPPVIAVLPSVVLKNGLNKDTFSGDNIGAFTIFEKEFLNDLEPYIQKNYPVSVKREDTGVCGLSMGGMEALRLGFAIKDHFNYIGSFSAAPTLDQSILTLDGWTYQPQTVLLCSGDADSTIGNNPFNYHQSLEENKVDHIWYQYPGGTHEEKVWKNGLVNFLKRSYRS